MSKSELPPLNGGTDPKKAGMTPEEFLNKLSNMQDDNPGIEIGRKEKVESQKSRLDELSEWLNEFKMEGVSLSLGKSQFPRVGVEQYGVYVDGRHIFDIQTKDEGGFNKASFFEQLGTILKVASLDMGIVEAKNEILGSRVKIRVEVDALDRLRKSGVKMSGDQWTFKNLDVNLYGKGENALVRVTEKGLGQFVMEITEKEGKVIQYDIKDGFFDIKSRREV